MRRELELWSQEAIWRQWVEVVEEVDVDRGILLHLHSLPQFFITML